jgi:hypothetical protein
MVSCASLIHDEMMTIETRNDVDNNNIAVVFVVVAVGLLYLEFEIFI